MKVYLASRYTRREEMRVYARHLQGWGYEVVSRWIFGDDGLEGDERANLEARKKFALVDLVDMDSADILISFTENPIGIPSEGQARGGRHVEFGYALARRKRLMIVGYRENIFHALTPIEYFINWLDCLEKLAYESEGVHAV